MRKSIKLLSALLMAGTAVSASSCDMLVQVFRDGVINGTFMKDTTYEFDSTILGVQVKGKYVFKEDGTVVAYDENGNSTSDVETTYLIKDGMITLTDTKTEEKSYIYYFGDFIYFEALLASFPCFKEGVDVSKKSSSKVVGYDTVMMTELNDTIEVFTGKEDSKGMYRPIYEDGHASEDEVFYLAKDQVTSMDTSKSGTSLADVKIDNHKYKAINITIDLSSLL